MDRVRPKRTILSFLGICTINFFVFIMLGTTVLITYTTHHAAKDATKRILSKEARHISNRLYIENGELKIEPGTQTEVEDIYFAVIVGEGRVFADNIPHGLENLTQVPVHTEDQLIQEAAENEKYYLFDHRVRAIKTGSSIQKTTTYPEDICIRIVIAANDVDTVYHSIQSIYYLFLILMIIILGIGWFWFYRRAVKPVNEMCSRIQQIIEAPEGAGKIDDKGPFRETEVMTEAYNRLLDQSAQLSIQQGEFNENVSHELRTPVALIRSECEMIEDLYQETIPPEVADAIAAIHRQGDRMNAMIAELLYLARINRDDYTLYLESVDLVDLAESAGEDAEDLTNGTRRFVYDLKPAAAEIDVTLVMIAVRNLITNAVRYSHENSEIRIATGVEEDLSFLQVQDEGIGIAEENRNKIFKPYYQVKEERNSEGFGLGLSLVQKIVELHGGKIILESKLDQGSTFTMFFQKKEREQ